jgi:hypothetical protein
VDLIARGELEELESLVREMKKAVKGAAKAKLQ